MTRPLLLDLFCGAGGAGEGYRRAGFDVLGVDINPQPRYEAGGFVQADALEYLDWLTDPASNAATMFHAIHASPPCQDHTRGGSHPVHGTGWMLAATRNQLEATGLPWVIENVPGAPMRADYKLCGCMFDLRLPGMQLIRERWFETSWHGFEMRSPCRHVGVAVSVVGHGTTKWARDRLGRCPSIAEYRSLMGIDWMDRTTLSQAIPPAYTEYIGAQLLEALAVPASP